MTVQVLVEVLRSWMVIQMVPAAPSLPWNDPWSAEVPQRSVSGRSLGGLVVQRGVSDPGPGCGLALGAELTGSAVADGWVAVETAR